MSWRSNIGSEQADASPNWFYNERRLLLLGSLCGITLLCIYHRNYDLILLAPIFSVCWNHAFGRGNWKFKAILICAIPFAFPSASILLAITKSGRLPSHLVNSLFWNAVVLPHTTYCVAAIVVLTLWILMDRQMRPALSIVGAQKED